MDTNNLKRKINIYINQDTIVRGDVIFIKSLSERIKSVRFQKKTYYPYFVDNAYYVFLPTTYNSSINKQKIEIEMGDSLYSYAYTFFVYVKKNHFKKSKVHFSQHTKQLFNKKGIDKERTNLLSLIKSNSTFKKISPPEIIPVLGKYRITSPYGAMRVDENDKPLWHHSGVDFGAETGTPIISPSEGIVLFADSLILQGNCIVIDHGAGIKSVYFHLNKLYVKEGQVVKKKEIIGSVGATGLSTGPHLHFGIYVNGKPINPLNFIKRRFK